MDAFAGNTQVDGRINPKLIDLVAALATGTVGAFALVRSDISDTLPGVAIAISLVPPLAVVGLLLSVQRYSDAAGALLLFATNVAAIMATGAIVLLVYRIRAVAEENGYPVGCSTGTHARLVIALVVIVAVPLTLGSAAVARDQLLAGEDSSHRRGVGQGEQLDARRRRGEGRGGGRHVLSDRHRTPSPRICGSRMNKAGLSDADLLVVLATGGGRICRALSETCGPLTER